MTEQRRTDSVSNLPLCVDMDGTLIRTDSLVESFFSMVARAPWLAFVVPLWLLQGKAHLKRKIASESRLNPAALPYNTTLLDFLRSEKSAGRKLVLATAADESIARAVAGHLALFDQVLSSDGSVNLRGKHKLAKLTELFGEKGFEYAADSHDDIDVFAGAAGCILVNPERGLSKKISSARFNLLKTLDDRFKSETLSKGNPREMLKNLYRNTRPGAWIRQLRLHHWIKNSFVFAPLIFSGKLTDVPTFLRTFEFFVAFGLISSGVYVFNDILDLEKDRMHPTKSRRPLASGQISVAAAAIVGTIMALTGLGYSIVEDLRFTGVLTAYIANNVLYSYLFKYKVLTDALSISIGFMLRFFAGGFAAEVELSRWLLVCGFSLTLFLGFGKRRTEIELLKKGLKSENIRPVLEIYSPEKLTATLSTVNAMCLISYIMYVTDLETIQKHHTKGLIFTVPIVTYGLFRYMYKTLEGKGDGPVDIIFTDKAFLLAIFAWVSCVLFILYL